MGICTVLCSFLVVGCVSAEVSPSTCVAYVVTPVDDTSKEDVRWANYLRDHLRPRAAGGEVLVPAVSEGGDGLFEVAVQFDPHLTTDFTIDRSSRGVCLVARDQKTMLWLQYQIIRSFADEDLRIDASDLPPALVGLADTSGRFAFDFRSLYTPASQDMDYVGILATESIESDWGLWGHQASRVLGVNPPKELLATVDGKSYDGQFCFSSDEAFRRIESYVIDHFGEGDLTPSRFVVAPTDDEAVCTCKSCFEVGNTVKSATPAVAKLLGRLAARFPYHSFFTLGYLSTREAPAMPMAANTGVLVSAIDLPLVTGVTQRPATAQFVDYLNGWKHAAPKFYVWDYIQNFDDYLTPFPMLGLVRERLQLYRERGITGVFFNGSGYDYTPFDDMRTYVLASLLVNPDLDVETLMRRFFTASYPLSGRVLGDFCAAMEQRAATSPHPLNLYGGIGDAERSWLDVNGFVTFYEALETLLPAARGNERKRLHELLTALSYTRLEIARHAGAGAYGFGERAGDALRVKADALRWLNLLEEYKAFPAMKFISESELPIEDYITAWRQRIASPQAMRNLLLDAELQLISKADEMVSDLALLTDGVRGLNVGYHYGWYITPTDLELSLPIDQASRARHVELSFLNLPRHRMLPPRSVELYKDGRLYKTLTPQLRAGGVATVSAPVDFSGAGALTIKVLRAEGSRTQIAVDELILIP